MKSLKTLAWLNLLALLVHITLSYITQLKMINQLDVGEVSDRYTSLFTPAGITFAIWGLIYLSLLAFCIYHIVMAYRQASPHEANQQLKRTSPWFIINNLAAAAWLIWWTQGEIMISAVLIVLQLLCLVALHLRLGIHQPLASPSSKIFTQYPLSIYLGWVSIATIANISVYLVSKDWSGAGYSAADWTRIMIGVAVLLTVIVILTRRNLFFGLVVIWALYGIIQKREADMNNYYPLIIQAAWIGIGVTAAACLYQLIRNLSVKRQPATVFPEAPASLK